MADIYLAGWLGPERQPHLVAIKELMPRLAARHRFADMFVAEAELVSRLDHPNITQVQELGRWAGVPHIVMELVEGIDLSTLLRQCCLRELALPIELRLTILCEVLRALDHAHQATDERGEHLGIVHRDVSPSNVLLDFDGKVKLCDFGIAIAASREGGDPETIEGKASYMSPEHARGEPVDRRADVFAAGILLWELLSGRRMYRPLEGETRIEVAAAARIPVLLVRGLPDEGRLHRVVHRALAEDPQERYPSAGAMLADLERWGQQRRMIASTDELAAWLGEHFADLRQARERARLAALAAMERKAPYPIGLTPAPSESLSAGWPDDSAAADDRDDEGPTESGARPARRSLRGTVDVDDEVDGDLFEPLEARPAQADRRPKASALNLLGWAAGTFAAALASLLAASSTGLL